MVTARCAGVTPEGRGCRAWPIRREPYCLWHSPEREEEAAEARRLGGLRRRREKTLAGAYDLTGLDTIPAIRRVVEIATFDTLGLENSIARARTLIAAAQVAAKLLETGELEERIAALELATSDRKREPSGGGLLDG